MTSAAIVVIAKTPVPGRVKTRLCPPCTPEQAAVLAAAALDDTLDTVGCTPAAARVLALDGSAGPWIPSGFVIVPQLGRGLDERLANALSAVTGPAVLIGMDTPQITPALLTAATNALLADGTDAVLGTAVDGGWWCIGLRRTDPRVFIGVPMSTDHTGAAQRDRLDALRLRTMQLPALRDVDTFADARAVAREAPDSRFAAAFAHLEELESRAG